MEVHLAIATAEPTQPPILVPFGSQLNGDNNVEWSPPAMIVIHTDSSCYEWGATLKIPGKQLVMAQGFWTTTIQDGHINEKTLIAIGQAILIC